MSAAAWRRHGVVAALIGAALGASGCAQSSDEWLAAIEPTADAAPPDDPADAGGPSVVAERAAPIPLPTVGAPRGLAIGADTGWTTDRDDDTLVAFDRFTGAERGRWPLPARGSPALALWEGALYLGFDDAIWRVPVEPLSAVQAEAIEPVDVAVRGLVGLALDGDGLVSAESDGLVRRDGARLAPRLSLRTAASPGRLVRRANRYLMLDSTPRAPGGAFSVVLRWLDATQSSGADTLGRLALPVDVSHCTGLAVADAQLFVLGAGYGEDVGQIVPLSLMGEAP